MKNIMYGATTTTPGPVGSGNAANLENCASAIQNKVSGKSLTITDVSPLEHKCSCKLTSDTYEEIVGGSNNIYDFKNNGNMRIFRFFGGGAPIENATCTVNNNGTVTINGFISVDMRPILAISISGLESGKEYTISVRDKDGNLLNCFIEPMLNGAIPDGAIDGLYGKVTFTAEDKYPTYMFYADLVNSEDGKQYNNETLYPQLEYGSVATDWGEYGGGIIEMKPHIEDFTTVKVKVNGKAYTPNADGTVTGVESVYPTMEITTDNEYANITDFTYCVDTKKYVDNRIAEMLASIQGV